MIPVWGKDESRSTTAVSSWVRLGCHRREDDRRDDLEVVVQQIDMMCTVHGLFHDLGRLAVPGHIQYALAQDLLPADGTRLAGIVRDAGDAEAQATPATAL